MSEMYAWRDESVQGFQIRGTLDDRDIVMNPNEITQRVKCELVSRICDELMKDIKPKIKEIFNDN